jgi:hypothetical protein
LSGLLLAYQLKYLITPPYAALDLDRYFHLRPGTIDPIVLDLQRLHFLIEVGRATQNVDIITHLNRICKIYYRHTDVSVEMRDNPDLFSFHHVFLLTIDGQLTKPRLIKLPGV